MLFATLFVIYLVLVSLIQYECPRHQADLDRSIEGVQEVMKTELSVIDETHAIASDSVEVPPVISPLQSAKEEVVVEPQPSEIASSLAEKDQEFLYDLPQLLPSSLRGLRLYIIEHKLQSRIREAIGKSYSHCKLSELKIALSNV